MSNDAPSTTAVIDTPAPAGGDAGAAGSPSRTSGLTVSAVASKYGLLIAFLVTIIVFSIARPDSFATGRNAESILTLAAPSLIIAVGLTVVLVMQDFDLSFGAMIGLGSGASTAFMVNSGWPWGLAVIAVILLGVLVGLVNGYMVAYLGGASFIITLAMGTVLAGVEFALTSQDTVFNGFPSGFRGVATNEFLGLSNQIWIAVVLAGLAWTLLDRTEIGRYMYAIGGNPEAARLSGVRVRPLRVLGFVVVAVAAAIVGLILTSQSGSYAPSGGLTYLLPAFAAAFLGAAVFRPGEFNVPGTIVGVLFLGVIQTGLIMLDFDTYVINLVQGAILITAVLVSRLGQRSA